MTFDGGSGPSSATGRISPRSRSTSAGSGRSAATAHHRAGVGASPDGGAGSSTSSSCTARRAAGDRLLLLLERLDALLELLDRLLRLHDRVAHALEVLAGCATFAVFERLQPLVERALLLRAGRRGRRATRSARDRTRACCTRSSSSATRDTPAPRSSCGSASSTHRAIPSATTASRPTSVTAVVSDRRRSRTSWCHSIASDSTDTTSRCLTGGAGRTGGRRPACSRQLGGTDISGLVTQRRLAGRTSSATECERRDQEPDADGGALPQKSRRSRLPSPVTIPLSKPACCEQAADQLAESAQDAHRDFALRFSRPLPDLASLLAPARGLAFGTGRAIAGQLRERLQDPAGDLGLCLRLVAPRRLRHREFLSGSSLFRFMGANVRVLPARGQAGNRVASKRRRASGRSPRRREAPAGCAAAWPPATTTAPAASITSSSGPRRRRGGSGGGLPAARRTASVKPVAAARTWS